MDPDPLPFMEVVREQRHGRRLRASQDVGVSATVSALALISRLPMEAFLAQTPTRPTAYGRG